MFLGVGLAMTNRAALLAVMAGAAIGIERRVRLEEKALCEDRGQPCRNYMQGIRRFVPFAWGLARHPSW